MIELAALHTAPLAAFAPSEPCDSAMRSAEAAGDRTARQQQSRRPARRTGQRRRGAGDDSQGTERKHAWSV